MSNILFTPGPLALSPFVKEAMLFDIGSRDAAFRRITQDIREQILAIVHGQDSHTVIPIQGSGTFAVEAALTTFVGSRDKVLVCVNGQYGDRILTILKRHDLAFEAVVCPVTRVPDLERVADRLRADPSFTHLCFVHCETTTGILNPMRALIDLARERGVVTIIDSMSAFGGIEIDARTDRFDILISSGNKCLEAPPGIAFAIVAKALLTRKATHARTYSLDLYDQWLALETSGEWRTTPPTHVAQSLHRALSMQAAEGTQARRLRYERVRDRVTTGLRPFGLTPVLRDDVQSPICIAFQAPHWITSQDEFDELYNFLAVERIYIYAKFHTTSQSFRVGCIGQIQEDWPDRLIERIGRLAPPIQPRRETKRYSSRQPYQEQINA